MEKKILRAVVDVTGITEEQMKSDSMGRDVSRARTMYYYLCNEKKLILPVVGALVNRSANSVSKGVSSFRELISRNKRYADLLNEAKMVLLGLGIEEQKDWMHYNDQDYIFIRGKKYSIHDISSRYFGGGYMGMIDDEFVLYSDNKEHAVRRLLMLAENQDYE